MFQPKTMKDRFDKQNNVGETTTHHNRLYETETAKANIRNQFVDQTQKKNKMILSHPL